MLGVHIEVGGIGSGQIITKDLVFGWIYIDGAHGSEWITLRDIKINDPDIYNDIMERLPVTIHAEISYEAAVWSRTQVNANSPTNDNQALPHMERPVATDKTVTAFIHEYGTGCDDWEATCLDILQAVSPLQKGREIYTAGECCGLIADILGGTVNDIVAEFQ